ncbi:MAG: DUF1931 domain-containing protein [Halorhabdus sp.]
MPEFVFKYPVRERLDGKAISEDFYEALDEKVAERLDAAERRAAANDRETVLARDV